MCILSKLSPGETICMKCQILFYRKNKKRIVNLSSAESAQRVVRLNKKALLDCIMAVIIRM